jgi:signal transduction histidine kinase
MVLDEGAASSSRRDQPVAAAAARQFSNLIPSFVVSYLEHKGGDELVARILGEAGETRSPESFRDATVWSTYGQIRRLLEATSRVLGLDAVFEVTATVPTVRPGSSYREMFLSMGSPAKVVAKAGELGTMFSSIVTIEAAEVGPCEWMVTSRFAPGFEPYPEYCSLHAGLFTTYPVYFGLAPAVVVEEACQRRGAPTCRFRVSWSEAGDGTEPAAGFEYLSDLLAVRLAELQRTVTDLVRSDDLENLLLEIVASARRAVNAPSYILALQAMPGALREVYAEGQDEAGAGRLAERLLAGDPAPGMLAVEVRSARRSYGWLAAVEPSGTRQYLAEERSVLDTYASVAAAALDVSSSLHQARQQTAAAEAMSQLLADERTLLSTVLEGLPHGVCWSDHSGHVDGCNQALVELLGHASVGDVRGRTWSELCGDPGATAAIETWTNQVLAGGSPVINAELALGWGREPLTALVSVVALGSEAEMPRVLCIWANVTDQRAMEKRLAEASRLESIGQLAAGIAHEINTPMQYIGDNGAFLGKAYHLVFGLVDQLMELAAGNGNDRDTLDELASGAKLDVLRRRIPIAAEQVIDGVDTVSEIVRSLKTFAHPGGSDFEPVDLHQVIESSVTVSRAQWKAVADLDLRLASQPVVARAVPGTLNQVAVNLIVNAAQAIEDRLAAGDDRPGEIIVATSAGDRWIEVTISDNGGGIPAEIRDKVYDQFMTTKAIGRGTGQGLAICRNLMAGNEGTIDFTTGPAGTTFTIGLAPW